MHGGIATDLPIDKRHSGQTTGVVIIGSNEHDDLPEGIVAQRTKGSHPDMHNGSAIAANCLQRHGRAIQQCSGKAECCLARCSHRGAIKCRLRVSCSAAIGGRKC